MVSGLSSKLAPSSSTVLARSSPAPRVLLAKPVLTRSVVVRFKEDDKDNIISKAQDKAQEQLDKLKQKPSSDAQSAKDYTNSKVQEGQNLMRSGTSFDSQVQTNWGVSAFTRRREVFAGRLAMLGFWAACFWEWYVPSHPNILQQLTLFSGRTGFEINEATWLTIIVGLIAYNGLTAVSPASPTLSEENQQDVAKRPKGPNDEVPNSPQMFLGIRGWGFNKANELFVGRTAMIGFAAALLGQMWLGGLQGPGPLAQVAHYLGTTANDAYYGSAGNFFIVFVGFAAAVSFLRGQFGTTQGEEDIY